MAAAFNLISSRACVFCHVSTHSEQLSYFRLQCRSRGCHGATTKQTKKKIFMKQIFVKLWICSFSLCLHPVVMKRIREEFD